MEAWLNSDKLKTEVLHRVDCDFRAGRLTNVMMGGQCSLREFPEQLGLPLFFGYALDAIERNASAAFVQSAGHRIVAAISVGADVSVTPLELAIEILRRKPGRDHPIAMDAIKMTLEAVAQRGDRRRFQIKDAAGECEHVSLILRRKSRDLEPAIFRAMEACRLAQSLANLVADNAFLQPDDLRTSSIVLDLFRNNIHERDINCELIDWLVDHLASRTRRD